MLDAMHLLFDSLLRALAYCLLPRVILLSLLPLLLMAVLILGLGHFYWTPASELLGAWLGSAGWLAEVSAWLTSVGVGPLPTVLAPLLLLVLVTPLVVIVSLLLVSLFMMPVLTSLVAGRRFTELERRNGGSLWASLGWSMVSVILALIALLVSMPLWLIPPLVLILPPLIWGWLTYRVMAFDALADFASREERQAVFERHQVALLAMGVFCGYLGAAPSLIWASGVLFVVLAPVLVPLAVWVYTWVFALSSLWFAHFCLAALHALRAERQLDRRSKPSVALLNDSLPLAFDHEPSPSAYPPV
jgi:hypothetical protein